MMNVQRYSVILNKQPTPPRIMNENTTNSGYIKLALPDYDVKQIANPNISNMINDYGIQIVTCRYYNKDKYFNEMEEVFNENKYGIIPLSNILRYYTKKKEENL